MRRHDIWQDQCDAALAQRDTLCLLPCRHKGRVAALRTNVAHCQLVGQSCDAEADRPPHSAKVLRNRVIARGRS